MKSYDQENVDAVRVNYKRYVRKGGAPWLRARQAERRKRQAELPPPLEGVDRRFTHYCPHYNMLINGKTCRKRQMESRITGTEIDLYCSRDCLGGELLTATREQVERHLERIARCRSLYTPPEVLIPARS